MSSIEQVKKWPGAKRSHPKWENVWKNIVKEKDLRVAVFLRVIEGGMKEEVPYRKDDQKKRKKRHRCRSKKNKKEYHWRHSYLPSSSSSPNDNSDENKYISTDSRFRVVSENHQYKYSLPPDMAQYTNVNFDTYIKEADLIKAVLIKNPVPENINPVKTLDERYP